MRQERRARGFLRVPPPPPHLSTISIENHRQCKEGGVGGRELKIAIRQRVRAPRYRNSSPRPTRLPMGKLRPLKVVEWVILSRWRIARVRYLLCHSNLGCRRLTVSQSSRNGNKSIRAAPSLPLIEVVDQALGYLPRTPRGISPAIILNQTVGEG